MDVTFSRQFGKDFERLPVYVKKATIQVIDDVKTAGNLFEITDCIAMKGHVHHYRIRRGEYRITLETEGESVLFNRVLSRGQIYKKH
jgi:mRNA-degrading endonuclease RelE of RelBE toxin-antitoxin system